MMEKKVAISSGRNAAYLIHHTRSTFAGYPHRMKFKMFNARYRLLAPSCKVRIAEERAVEDTHLILQRIEQKYNLKQQQNEISMSWAFGKRHIFLR